MLWMIEDAGEGGSLNVFCMTPLVKVRYRLSINPQPFPVKVNPCRVLVAETRTQPFEAIEFSLLDKFSGGN